MFIEINVHLGVVASSLSVKDCMSTLSSFSHFFWAAEITLSSPKMSAAFMNNLKVVREDGEEAEYRGLGDREALLLG